MESITVVALVLAAIVCSSAEPSQPQPTADPLPDHISDEHVPILTVNIGRLFPFFGSSDVDSSSDSDEGDANFMKESAVNSSQEQPGLFAVSFMEVISFNTDDNNEEDSREATDEGLPRFPFLFDKMILGSFGVLDLSGRNLTGEELATELVSRQMLGQPVTSLILSNSRLEGLSVKSFQPVQDTLRDLRMDNCTVSLEALSELSNLQFLNLSNNGLTGFHWYPKLQGTLEVLDLSHNKLDEICPEFSLLTNLRELYLSHNRIVAVEESSGLDLLSLQVLSLTMNGLSKAMLQGIYSLQRVELDWNYLRLFGQDVRLPAQLESVKLASNPWRCDCGILGARDNYNVLDIDMLQCANSLSYSICDDCRRYFLPNEGGRLVTYLTKDSIEHLGCTGLVDQYYLLRQGLRRLKEHEPEKLAKLGVFMLAGVLMLVGTCLLCRGSSKKKFNRQTWLKIQQIPYLQISKVDKPSEVPYIKIGSSQNMQA